MFCFTVLGNRFNEKMESSFLLHVFMSYNKFVYILTIYLNKLELGLDLYVYMYVFTSLRLVHCGATGLFYSGTLTLSLPTLTHYTVFFSSFDLGGNAIFRFSISSFEHGIFNTRLSSGSARRPKPGSARALEEAQRSGVLANDCNNYAYLSLSLYSPYSSQHEHIPSGVTPVSKGAR